MGNCMENNMNIPQKIKNKTIITIQQFYSWVFTGRKQKHWFKKIDINFPGGPVVKNSPANAADMGSIPGPGKFHMPQGNWACVLQPKLKTAKYINLKKE